MSEDNPYNKVLLVNPPSKVFIYADGSPAHRKHCTPPLGLAYLASNLLQFDYQVEVLDAVAEGYQNEWFEAPYLYYGLGTETILARIEQSQPDVVGISVLFSNIMAEVHTLCAEIKQRFPDVVIVLGGHHPTGAAQNVMQDESIDYVMIGEADVSFVQFLEHLNGRLKLDEVQALYYRQDGEIRSTMADIKPMVEGDGWAYYNRKDAGVPLDLDGLPLPAWHLFPMQAYWQTDVRIGGGDCQRDRYAVMMSTRGCPHACYFCTSPLVSGFKGYRRRSNESVIAEIRWLRDEFGVQEIQFLDDNFYVSKPRVKTLLRLIADEFPDMVFGVPGGTEVNALDEEVIDLMAEANFYKTLLAIEAGDPELQSTLIDKKVRVHEVPKTVEYLHSKGIETRALFMIGFPDETKDQIGRTVELAKSLNVDDFYISLVTPLPGTPLYDECVERNLFVDGFDVNNIRFSVASIRLPDTTADELEGIRRTVWQERFVEMRQRLADEKQDERKRRFSGLREYELVGFQSLDQVREKSTAAST